MLTHSKINQLDRADPVNEWELERDQALFTSHGYWCEIKRNPTTGALCGYVYMGKHHPYTNDESPDVDVHGGITFNDGKKMGFDCAHAGDLSPRLNELTAQYGMPREGYGEVYRNWAYVEQQVEMLAAQLRAVDPIMDIQPREIPNKDV